MFSNRKRLSVQIFSGNDEGRLRPVRYSDTKCVGFLYHIRYSGTRFVIIADLFTRQSTSTPSGPLSYLEFVNQK